MATGDIQYIKKLGSVLLPGGGQTTTGGKKQNKVLVWGHIATDDYDQDKGVDLDAEVSDYLHALGVDTLDFIDFQVVSLGLTKAMKSRASTPRAWSAPPTSASRSSPLS